MSTSRTTIPGFARLTRDNLELAKTSFDTRKDFHIITQVVNSLLGLVVVPSALHSKKAYLQVKLDELADPGWPEWEFTGKEGWESETLGDFLRGLRNAAAHGHFIFLDNPNSRCLEKVRVSVSDGPHESAPWRYEIQGDQLYCFCIWLSEYIDKFANEAGKGSTHRH